MQHPGLMSRIFHRFIGAVDGVGIGPHADQIQLGIGLVEESGFQASVHGHDLGFPSHDFIDFE